MIEYTRRMRAYTIDLRQRILQAVDEGCTCEEAAALFEVHVATVRRYRRLRDLEGDLAPRTSPGRSLRIIAVLPTGKTGQFGP